MTKHPSQDDDGRKQSSAPKPASPKAAPKMIPRPSKAEHAARKRADKQIAKPWMKKR